MYRAIRDALQELHENPPEPGRMGNEESPAMDD